MKGTQASELGITVQGITSGTNFTSHVKFTGTGLDTLMTERVYKIGELFSALENVVIRSGSVQVAVTAGDQTIRAVYVPNAENWAEGTLTLYRNPGMEGGYVHITIQDYFYCETTTVGFHVTDSFEIPVDPD